MKKLGILNSEISAIFSQLGHTDRIVIFAALSGIILTSRLNSAQPTAGRLLFSAFA